jgi:alpha-beta hydrolase superfamily lysophospholipase
MVAMVLLFVVVSQLRKYEEWVVDSRSEQPPLGSIIRRLPVALAGGSTGSLLCARWTQSMYRYW